MGKLPRNKMECEKVMNCKECKKPFKSVDQDICRITYGNLDEVNGKFKERHTEYFCRDCILTYKKVDKVKKE